MELFMDVGYKPGGATAIGLLVESGIIISKIEKHIIDVNPYQPGEFYKRELPCLQKVYSSIQSYPISKIIIDGYVYIDNNFKLGLGGHFYFADDKRTPVIGVAKSFFKGNEQTCTPILRGKSKNPLYISSIGISIDEAVNYIQNLNGDYRIPDIMQKLDRLTKTI